MALHDEPGAGPGPQAVEPEGEEPVKGGFADPDRRVRPDAPEPEVGQRGHVGGGPGEGRAPLVHHHGMDLFGPVGRRVLGAQRHRPLVHVDGPHPRPRCPPGKRCGDGPVATAEVEDVAHRVRRMGRLLQQQSGAGVDAAGGEDPSVGRERELEVGQRQGDRSPIRRRRGLAGEVLGGAGRSPSDATLGPWPRTRDRIFGDPVLKQKTAEVTDIDGTLVRLADDMFAPCTTRPASASPPPRWACRSGSSSTTCDDRPRHHHQPRDRREPGRVGLRRGVPVRCPAWLSRSCGPKEIHVDGLRPRRQRGRHRGRRARRPGVPARDRPPRRRAPLRAPRPTSSARRPARRSASWRTAAWGPCPSPRSGPSAASPPESA